MVSTVVEKILSDGLPKGSVAATEFSTLCIVAETHSTLIGPVEATLSPRSCCERVAPARASAVSHE